MCSAHCLSHRFRTLLSLALLLPFVVQIHAAVVEPFPTTSYQTIPTPSCNTDAVVIPDMGISSGINRLRGEIHGEPGPYEYRHPQSPLDVEGYPVAPADLELEQVHVFVRHGALFLLFTLLCYYLS